MTDYNFHPFNHSGVVRHDRNAVVVRVDSYESWLCGYIAVPAELVPESWHGNYDADALQYLNIHGGITYCEVAGGLANDALRDAAMNVASEKVKDKEWLVRYTAVKAAAKSVPYTHVVFGFDCHHLHDDINPKLQDPDHVLELVKDMGNLLGAYANRIDEWRAADRAERARIIDEINTTAKHEQPMSFGAVLGMLSGLPEFDKD